MKTATIARRALIGVLAIAVLGMEGAGAGSAARGNATIGVPASQARVMVPLHILAHTVQPGARITVSLHWANGATLQDTFTTLRDSDGSGLLIANLDWNMEHQPPQPATQAATLEMSDRAGAVLARQNVTVLGAHDRATQEVSLYWVLGSQLYAAKRRIPTTSRIATATLQELLWGPNPSLAGFETALPTPEQILRYAGRDASWGDRVTVRRLTIAHGVATVDFSPELQAYGGDTTRGRLIYQQVSRTLEQFPTIQTVRITIAGQPFQM